MRVTILISSDVRKTDERLQLSSFGGERFDYGVIHKRRPDLKGSGWVQFFGKPLFLYGKKPYKGLARVGSKTVFLKCPVWMIPIQINIIIPLASQNLWKFASNYFFIRKSHTPILLFHLKWLHFRIRIS